VAPLSRLSLIHHHDMTADGVDSRNPEDKQTRSFSGAGGVREWSKPRKQTGVFIFGAGGCQRLFKTPKTSSHAHFQGWWLSVVG